MLQYQFILFFFFFFNDTATTEIYTLSLHDALPILAAAVLTNLNVDLEEMKQNIEAIVKKGKAAAAAGPDLDRKSTRLNSSHLVISYAVFCLKKKKKK